MDVIPSNSRDAAMLVVALHMRRLKKFVEANRQMLTWNREGAYKEALQKYFKLHPKFEKITRHTDLNNNGDCKGLIKKLIDG